MHIIYISKKRRINAHRRKHRACVTISDSRGTVQKKVNFLRTYIYFQKKRALTCDGKKVFFRFKRCSGVSHITKKRVKFYINVRWKKVFFDSRGTESNFTHIFICVFPKNRALTCDGRKYFSIQEVQCVVYNKKKESNFTHTFLSLSISKKPRINVHGRKRVLGFCDERVSERVRRLTKKSTYISHIKQKT